MLSDEHPVFFNALETPGHEVRLEIETNGESRLVVDLDELSNPGVRAVVGASLAGAGPSASSARWNWCCVTSTAPLGQDGAGRRGGQPGRAVIRPWCCRADRSGRHRSYYLTAMLIHAGSFVLLSLAPAL